MTQGKDDRPEKMSNLRTPPPLFKTDRQTDRPLFVIFVILTFLASLALFGVISSFRMADTWRHSLDNKITIFVKPASEPVMTPSRKAEKARTLLMALPEVKTATLMPETYARELLRPWLGDLSANTALPIPQIIELKTTKRANIDAARLQTLLQNAGINADIDTHAHWAKGIKRSVKTMKWLGMFSLLLILTAVGAAALFATRASIASHRQILAVLHQLGTPVDETAKILSKSLGIMGLKAGVIGAGAGLLIASLVRMVFETKTSSPLLLPVFHLGGLDILALLFMPILLAALIIVLSWKNVTKMLNKDIYR